VVGEEDDPIAMRCVKTVALVVLMFLSVRGGEVVRCWCGRKEGKGREGKGREGKGREEQSLCFQQPQSNSFIHSGTAFPRSALALTCVYV
jgi:hypothetical protein